MKGDAVTMILAVLAVLVGIVIPDQVHATVYNLHLTTDNVPDYGHRYILNLLPGQCYTRYWKPLDPQAFGVDAADTYRPLRGKDPDEQHNLHNIRGNGLWWFVPDLQDPCGSDLWYDSQNVAITADLFLWRLPKT